ncbi:MAG: hypothetical protein ACPHXR_05275 [Flavicella sp.]
MKIFINVFVVLMFSFMVACSSSDSDSDLDLADQDQVDDVDNSPDPTKTVYERLQEGVYRQIENVGDCEGCEDEINYYIFTDSYYQIVGTELNGTCEQNDKFLIDNCLFGCINIVDDTVEKLIISFSPFGLEQTITFTNDTTINFDFPSANESWTAELYSDELPDCSEY